MRYLFIAGAGRSGTSILTELISSHPEISLGMERFKRLYNKNVLSKGHFNEKRFNLFDASETNIMADSEQYLNYYKLILSKYSESKIVGDKCPHLFKNYDYLNSI